MKVSNYESRSFLYTVLFVVSIVLLFITIFSIKKNIRTYEVINSTVVKDNLVNVLVTNQQLKTIYNNKYLYIGKKKIKNKIVEVNKKVLKRSNKYYHSVLLKVKLNSKDKVNDTKKILFFDGKITTFDMMKVIWKGV